MDLVGDTNTGYRLFYCGITSNVLQRNEETWM